MVRVIKGMACFNLDGCGAGGERKNCKTLYPKHFVQTTFCSSQFYVGPEPFYSR